MYSKERVLTAFQHKEPDRVPLFEAWIEHEIAIKLGTDPCTARINLGLDCLPLGEHPETTKAYKDGIDEWGRVFKNGHYSEGLIRSWKDLEHYTPTLSHAKEWFPHNLIKRIKKKYEESYALYFSWHDCSLGLTYMSLGMEYFFQMLYEDQDLVKALIENSTNWIIALVEQANIEGVDFIILGDDSADNNRPFISPTMFKQIIIPQYKKITRISKVPIIWHSDGNIEALVPLIAEAGFAGVHSLESKAGIDLAKIKRDFGQELVLAGNVDTTEVLCQNNLIKVREEVHRAIKEGAPGGGYLFSSANSLFEGHNLQAIIETYQYAKKIGNYPIK